MRLNYLIHSQTSMVELSKFGISNFILQYTLLGMQLLIHAGMAVDRSEVGLVVA